MTTATPAAPPRSSWRPTPLRLARLVLGLWVFGTGEALLVAATLGNAPWTVFAEGVALHTPLTIGIATQLIGVCVLLGWLPLRVRPGLGTILNVILIGAAIDVMLPLLGDPTRYVSRAVYLLGGVALVGVGSGLYLTAAMGPGPRDGWMTGLHRRFGWPLSAVRFGIEVTVLTLGWLLGGTVGVGTVVFALLIGPAVGTAVSVVDRRMPLRPVVPPGAPRA